MAILRIELLEDCDMNSGRVVNTYFADDVFFDGFGLPYIPAWIIRNSLLKAAEEEGVDLTDEEREAILGSKARLVLDDGLIADRESLRQAISTSEFGGILIRNAQAVLNGSGFVNIHDASAGGVTQYVRVLAKGTIFEAFFELDDAHLEAFENLVHRLRGLYVGHMVRARFSIDEEWERPRFDVAAPQVDFSGERCRLEYDLHLISRTASLDRFSGDLDSDPHIMGGKVREALARKEELADIFAPGDDSIRCSFAYVAAGDKRGLPVPACFSTKKQDKTDLRDRCSLGRRPDDYDQIKGMGRVFIDDLDAREIYAARTRDEQGIFKYYEDGQMKELPYSAIGQGQTFKGFIDGPAESIKRIYEALMADGYVRVGVLANIGFGNAFLQVRSVAPIQVPQPVFAEEITVLLVSPERLYRGGLYEPSAQNVLEEVQRLLGGGVELEIVRNSQKTYRISAFNKAWGEYEPLEYAMQSGSVYRMRAKDGSVFDVSRALGGAFIGGHCDAGYGEVLVVPAVDAYYRRISYGLMSEEDFPLTSKADPNPGRRLMRSLYQGNANALASYLGSSKAETFVKDNFLKSSFEEIRSTVGDDFDLEEAFGAYVDALRESGLNVIRRGHLD